MSKYEKWVHLVQTAVTVEAINRKMPGADAAVMLAVAIDLPEASLPDGIEQACAEFVAYSFDNTVPKPRFLVGKI